MIYVNSTVGLLRTLFVRPLFTVDIQNMSFEDNDWKNPAPRTP